jgi:hypothetical protein
MLSHNTGIFLGCDGGTEMVLRSFSVHSSVSKILVAISVRDGQPKRICEHLAPADGVWGLVLHNLADDGTNIRAEQDMGRRKEYEKMAAVMCAHIGFLVVDHHPFFIAS